MEANTITSPAIHSSLSLQVNGQQMPQTVDALANSPKPSPPPLRGRVRVGGKLPPSQQVAASPTPCPPPVKGGGTLFPSASMTVSSFVTDGIRLPDNFANPELISRDTRESRETSPLFREMLANLAKTSPISRNAGHPRETHRCSRKYLHISRKPPPTSLNAGLSRENPPQCP